MTDYLPWTVLVAISLVGFPSSDKLIIVLYVTPKFPRKQEKNKIYTNESIVYLTNTQSGYSLWLMHYMIDRWTQKLIHLNTEMYYNWNLHTSETQPLTNKQTIRPSDDSDIRPH